MLFIYSLFYLTGCGISFLFSNGFLVLILILVIIGILKYLRFAILLKGMLILLLAFLWSQYQIHQVFKFQLPSAWEGIPLILTGSIEGMPVVQVMENQDQNHIFFKIKTNKVCHEDHCLRNKTIIRLQGKNLKVIPKAGEIWQLPVKLKRIHGPYNAGVMSKELIAFREGVRAAGKIIFLKNDPPRKIKNASRWSLNAKREWILNRIKTYLPNTPTSHWITALVLGERQGILPQEWQILRETGTNHLFAIAGLHLGLLASFIYWASKRVFKLFPLLFLKIPASHLGHIFACLGVLLYGAASGFLIPGLRAFSMYFFYCMSLCARMHLSAWSIWSLSLMFSLGLDPFFILNESFWLSFLIVGCLIFYFKNRLCYLENKKIRFFKELFYMQSVITVGASALSIYFYSEISLIGWLANLIAVPWLEFFILPWIALALMFALFSVSLSKIIFQITDGSLSLLWRLLEFLSNIPFAHLEMSLPIWGVLSLLFLSLCFLLPRGLKLIFFILTGLFALIQYEWRMPILKNPQLKMIDVGQGLSVILETAHHTLIYDTGGAWKPFYDSGESIIAPILRQDRRHHIDKLIISHGDMDHRGGADYLIRHFPVYEILSSAREYFPHSLACEAGQHWDWDGVHFSMIFPEKNTLFKGNNASCVLKIQYAQQSILLTGDIEKAAQTEMMIRRSVLPATILIAPHHGSKTSLQLDWISKVHPSHVVFSTGYLNAFHLPHPSVVSAYQTMGARLWNTAACGQIEFELSEKGIVKPICHREYYPEIWLDSIRPLA